MKGLSGKVCIVAGAATGIGQAVALRLAEEGAKVVVADVSLEGAIQTADRANVFAGGDAAIAVAFDMADEASIAAMVRAAVDQFGGLDGIHVNANDMRIIAQDSDALDVSLQVFDRTMEVGLKGHLLCTRHALPELLKRGGGAIVYTTSMSAYVGEESRVCYGMAKAGLTALTRHVARRWGKEGVRANAIAPGVVITDQLRDHFSEGARQYGLAMTVIPRLGVQGDIAGMVALLLSDDGAWTTGQVISVDGGATMRP